MSTISCIPPISTDLKLRPDLTLALSCLNSGSRGCWDAISSQFIPMSPIDAMTQLRSEVAASSLAAEAAWCVNDADPPDEVVEDVGGIIVDDVDDELSRLMASKVAAA